MSHDSGNLLKNITVLGATGSIGGSTLDVVSQHLDKYKIFALSAFTRIQELALLCQRFRPVFAVVADTKSANQLHRLLNHDGMSPTEILIGVEGLKTVAAHQDVHIVVAAIVGAAGLKPTLSAVQAGKRVLLANKEALVMSGSLFMEAARQAKADLLPIDSEHNAIFQCLSIQNKIAGSLEEIGVNRLLLTASGGPFREWSIQKLATVTPEQACRHPNWSMGQKISVDSASMMNKGLELIEACWLFDVPPSKIDIVVHPQSVIHSMVEYIDGSILAQLGYPDMRTPIAHALAWPNRINSGVPKLDFGKMAQFSFEQPDVIRFPCLRLAREVAEQGGTAPTVLNAANEVAVSAFLEGTLPFDKIANVVSDALDTLAIEEATSLDAILDVDRRARERARFYLDIKGAC